VNKLVKMRNSAVATTACVVALLVARPLNASSSCFLLAIIISSLFGGRGPGCSPLDFLQSRLTFSSFPPRSHS
jgi:hypothetical protein